MDISTITVTETNDSRLTDFGKAILKDRYLLEDETYQGLFARVSAYYGDDADHAQRIYNYMSKLWFMPATPILSNGGTKRGLPISCFLNQPNHDSLEAILGLWNENVWLASQGGGIGSYFGNIRSINETVHGRGKTSGIIPFIKVQDALTLAISQGSLRRGSSAVYLDVSHPEIKDFIDIRKPTGGDPNRKALNIHHGVVIPDAFMEAVEKGDTWDLISPRDGHVVETVAARTLWAQILTARIETGEPYLLFIDNVNDAIPEHQKKLGLKVKTSNLCSEITLPTGEDHLGNMRTAICCLSSLNLEYFDEWRDEPKFIEDVLRFLDNVLDDFIEQAPPSMANAVYSAKRERSVGLGVMGFHSFLQKQRIPMESVMAKVWNNKIFEHIKVQADAVSKKLAKEKGPCEDAKEAGIMERFSNKMAIAPTASISIICGNSSPGIEPYAANSFTQKTLTGSFTVRNKNLAELLEEKGKNTEDVWSSISTNEGSVQHLDFLTDDEKDVFKTAPEIDQKWVVELAGDRAKFICQAQSLNVFLPGNVHKKLLHDIHFQGWKKGIKSFYYCRSTSIQRADKVSHAMQEQTIEQMLKHDNDNPDAILADAGSVTPNNYEECLACQ